jgi:hypothetical protein
MQDHVNGKDWNEGHPDHEGEMAVSQLHRLVDMAQMLLNIIGESDELPAWVQYKLGRAYNDMNDLFGYIESKSHESNDVVYHDNGMMSTNIDATFSESKGLWHNIHKRKKAGKRPKKPGEKGYPDSKAWKNLTK